jgi:peptidoglycan/LPS O-acetylase OafA/YrhL
LGFGGIVLLAVHAQTQTGLFRFIVRWLSPIGRYSYSIYLWHVPVIIVVHIVVKRWAIAAGPYPEMAADLCFAALVGWFFAMLIEIPTLRLRDRLYPSNATSMETTYRTAVISAVDPV